MKTKILLLLFSCIGFSMFPQIPILTMVNSGPQPGDVFHSIYADTTGVGLGSPGANQSWDYSNLVLGTRTHEETWMIPDTLHHPDIHNATAYCFTDCFPDRIENYLEVTASAYSILASAYYSSSIPWYMGANYAFVYSEPLILFTYPLNFSDSITFAASASLPNSFAVSTASFRKGSSFTTADGYGSLHLPSGTINNVLRVKNVQNFRDSMVYPVTQNFFVHNETYFWYDGIHKTPLLNIQKSTRTYTDTIYYSKFVFVAEGLNGINDRSECGMTFYLYPNPAVNRTNLAFNFTKRIKAGFSILTMTGKEVLNVEAEMYDMGEHTRSIDVSQLPRGLYIIKCETPSGNVFRKMFLN